MKKLITIVAAVFFSVPALAFDTSRLSVGLTGNYGVYAADGQEKNYNRAGTVDRTTKVNDKAFVDEYASIMVEYALNDQVSIGVERAEAFQTPKNINEGEGGDNGTDITVEAKFDEFTHAYLMVKGPLGFYAKAGIAQVSVDVTSENAGTYTEDHDIDGEMLAIGYSHDTGNSGISLRAEIAYHTFDDISANNGVTSSNSSQRNEIEVSDMRGATAKLSIVKSF